MKLVKSDFEHTGRRLRIVVLGGGNGISAPLRGLARRIEKGDPLDVVAIVATADDGGSSGRMRRERGGLPPGDLRNCLLALAPATDGPLVRVFGHRYDGSGPLSGHVVGNLVLSALAAEYGDYRRAVEAAGEMLGCLGRVIPVTLRSVRLAGVASDKTPLLGESRIGRSHCAMSRVWLEPEDIAPTPEVGSLIRNADLVVLGPGSLFTSLLPVLLVRGVARAARESRGRRVLVANMMTQPGETLGMNLKLHLEALDRHVGHGTIQVVLANGGVLPRHRISRYAANGAEQLLPVSISNRSEQVISAQLVTRRGKVRHDPDLLATELLALVARDSADKQNDQEPRRLGEMDSVMTASRGGRNTVQQ